MVRSAGPLEIILQDIERALQAQLWYVALAVTLSLPDICSLLEMSQPWSSRKTYGDITLQEARTHVEIKSRPVTVDEIELKADALYEAGIDLMSFLIDLNVVPETPRERKRGVNTPKSRKARKKNGK